MGKTYPFLWKILQSGMSQWLCTSIVIRVRKDNSKIIKWKGNSETAEIPVQGLYAQKQKKIHTLAAQQHTW